MKITSILWLSLCAYFPSQGQTQLDSLKKLLQEARDGHYAIHEAYQRYQIGSYFVSVHQYDSALLYYHKGLESQPRPADSASLFNGIGVVYNSMGLSNRSIPYYKQAISLWDRLKDTTNVLIGSHNLAIIYKDLGLYDEALEISFNALPKLESQPPSRQLASSYNTIGTVYERVQDYNKAYEFFRKSLAVRLIIQYEAGVGQSYNNIGELFIEMSQYDSALNNLNRAADIRRKINDTRGLGRTLTLIGNTLLQSGKIAEAKASLNEGLSFNKAASDNIGEVATLNGLGAVYLSTKEFALAEKELDKALSIITKSNTKEHLKKNLELHADVYRSTNNKSKLIETFERIMTVKDSLLNAEKVKSLVTLEIRYETDKKEQEITSLQQQRRLDKIELQTSKIQVYSLSIGLLLVVIIAALAYRIYRQTQREKLSAELHTKEVQHRMKNHLQILASIFTIQASLLTDRQAQELVKSTEGRVTAMALLHKKLYDNDGTTELGLCDYVTDLVNSILFTYGFDENKLTLNVDVIDIHLPVDKTIRIGLVLNELITNALKYAFSVEQESLLIVKIDVKNDSIHIEVADNGKGKSSEPVSKQSFGLRMVHSIVKELKGNIHMNNDHGTKYEITIPQK